MSSVNTNVGVLVAQKFLRSTASEMAITQNRISSGLRVASVLDDSSSFGVASSLRADLKGYTAVAGALQGAKTAAQIAVTAGETIAKRIEDVKAKVLQLADGSLSSASRTTYQNDLNSMVDEVNNYLDQAAYEGKNLIGSGGSDVIAVANIDASTVTMRNADVADLAALTLPCLACPFAPCARCVCCCVLACCVAQCVLSDAFRVLRHFRFSFRK